MATLQITKKLHITPLIDIQNPAFAQWYVSGVRWRLFGWRTHGEVEAQGPLPEHYLIDNLKMCAQFSRFDGRHEEPLREDIGFFPGMYVAWWDAYPRWQAAPGCESPGHHPHAGFS